MGPSEAASTHVSPALVSVYENNRSTGVSAGRHPSLVSTVLDFPPDAVRAPAGAANFPTSEGQAMEGGREGGGILNRAVRKGRRGLTKTDFGS